MRNGSIKTSLQAISTRVRIRDLCKEAENHDVTLDLTGVVFISRAAAHELVRQREIRDVDVDMSAHVEKMVKVVCDE